MSTSEKETIREAIMRYYHDGHAKYDPAHYEQILHPEWKFFLIEEGDLRIVDRDEFCEWYHPDNVRPELEWKTEFFSIDVTGDIAAVKLSIEHQNIKYIDYLNLMKIKGQWWIVHKLSHEIIK